VYNEGFCFFYIFITHIPHPPRNKVGRYIGIGLSIRPSVDAIIGFWALKRYPFHLESLITNMDYPWEKDVPYQVWGQRSSALDIKVEIWFPGSKVLSFPHSDTYGLPLGRRCSLSNLGSKGLAHWVDYLL
jgi:hypothetical protein